MDQYSCCEPDSAHGGGPAVQVLDLDALANMATGTLTELYLAGDVPESLDALDGNPACRMLAVKGLDNGAPFGGLRALASWGRFPWEGKRFSSTRGARQGTGINRIRLGGGRLWYPFETRVEPSAMDGGPCILLDYDLPANPRPIRMIRDELRQVSPGLFLGPAMLDTKKSPPRLVLYFACDTRGEQTL